VGERVGGDVGVRSPRQPLLELLGERHGRHASEPRGRAQRGRASDRHPGAHGASVSRSERWLTPLVVQPARRFRATLLGPPATLLFIRARRAPAAGAPAPAAATPTSGGRAFPAATSRVGAASAGGPAAACRSPSHAGAAPWTPTGHRAARARAATPLRCRRSAAAGSAAGGG